MGQLYIHSVKRSIDLGEYDSSINKVYRHKGQCEFHSLQAQDLNIEVRQCIIREYREISNKVVEWIRIIWILVCTANHETHIIIFFEMLVNEIRIFD